jgi:hypothetical protein
MFFYFRDRWRLLPGRGLAPWPDRGRHRRSEATAGLSHRVRGMRRRRWRASRSETRYRRRPAGGPGSGVPHVWPQPNVGLFGAVLLEPSGDVIDLDEGRSSSGIRGIAAPEPIPRVGHQLSRDRVAMHVFELLSPLRGTPDVEIVKTPLPKLRQCRRASLEQKRSLSRGLLPFRPTQTLGDPQLQAVQHPRAIGQVVGAAATVAYAAGNVRPRLYPNSGGGGINILITPTEGSRIGLDIHSIPEANGGVRPHIDITIKGPGVPSGPGSNLVNIKHWPW